MRLRPLAVGVVLLCGAATAAAAQQAPTAAATPAGRQERQLKITGSLQTIYDSNLARSNRAVAAGRGIKPEDITFRPQIAVQAVQPLGTQALFVNAGAGYDLHKENKRLDRGRFDVQGGYSAQVGPCQPTFGASYRGQQSDFEDSDVTTSSNFLQSEGRNASISCQSGPSLGVNIGVQRDNTKNSATVMKVSDRTTRGLTASVSYGNPNIGRAQIGYSYNSNQFPNRVIPGRPIGDGYISTSYSVGVERDFGSRLNVNAQAGRTYVKREFAPPGTPLKFASTTYSGGLSYRVGQRIKIDAQGQRGVNPSSRPGKLYDVSTVGQISAAYNFGTRFIVSLGERVQDSDSNVDTALVTQVITNSRTYATFGSIAYRQSDKASLVLDVRQEDRTTNLPVFDYSATRIGLTAQVRY